MGRELRRVPANWEHPKDHRGRHLPMHDRSYEAELAEWIEERAEWLSGRRRNYGDGPRFIPKTGEEESETFEEWAGSAPQPEHYMHAWPDEERTHFQMYETCSEGTPISPVMATPEEVARWCADNGASMFGCMTATYEQWLAVCQSQAFGLLVATPGEPLTTDAEFRARVKEGGAQ